MQAMFLISGGGKGVTDSIQKVNLWQSYKYCPSCQLVSWLEGADGLS